MASPAVHGRVAGFRADGSSPDGAQEPGETVEIAFPTSGSFLVFCGIHPKMELYVDVAP